MPVRFPSQPEAFNFICGTHAVERIKLSLTDVEDTYRGKAKIPNPYVDGHLRAINYIFERLVDKADFPARTTAILTNRFKSDVALNWLKDIHSLMLSPLVGHPIVAADPNAPQRQFIGNWRIIPAMNTFSIAPQPELIPKLLHLWLLDLTTLNTDIKPYLDQPYGITKEKAHLMEQTTYKANLFLSTTQPFVHANNRLGRLVENALRLHWRLPWKICSPGHAHEDFVRDLVEYQKTELPKMLAAAKNLDL